MALAELRKLRAVSQLILLILDNHDIEDIFCLLP